MGHPCRIAKRAKKKQAKEKMLSRRNLSDYLDLTPYNAVGRIKFKEEFAIKYK
ncbi:MAG TPA: hypothetical protein PLY40_03030 [Bacillota bacterium]|nr:hypothetical protein [Bacillota bacterium]